MERVNVLLNDIYGIAMKIQLHTDYVVFINFSGHVSTLNIHIAESEKNYSIELYRGSSYTAERKHLPLAEVVFELETLRDELEGFYEE